MIPPDHRTEGLRFGCGRTVADGCHFVDRLRHLTGVPIVEHDAVALGRHPSRQFRSDKLTLTIELADGSVGTINYVANGRTEFPKERIEVFCGGRVL